MINKKIRRDNEKKVIRAKRDKDKRIRANGSIDM